MVGESPTVGQVSVACQDGRGQSVVFPTGLRVSQGSGRALILLAIVASLGCDVGVVSGALIE